MAKKRLTGLSANVYEHPFDRKALISLEKMPGISMLFKKINEYGIDRLLRFKFGAISIRVNSRNFPEIYQAFEETCEILDIPSIPDLYLLHGTGYIRTIIIGANSPMVIINIDGVERLSYDELLYAFGHELGHIKSRHLMYHQVSMILPALGKVIANSTLGLGGLASNGVEFALFQWVMMAKLTSDRAALLACQDVDVAISSLIKLAGLPEKYVTPVMVEEFIAQAKDFESYDLDHLDKATKMLSFMEPFHPWTTLRASELLKWIESGEYETIVAGDFEPMQEPIPLEIPVTKSEEQTDSSWENTEEDEEWDFLTSWN